MKVASLFSGCGGLDEGLHQAGHDVILLCDSDPGARQVLKAQFPGVRIHDDVVSLQQLPEETELLAAGFPCIDVSRAGKRLGLEGQSTSLVHHVFRLLQRAKDDRRPVPWVLLENVEALLDRHGGEPPVIQYCLQRLMELGYGSWAYRVVNSAGFGLPNRRRRVFIVASLHGDARDVLLSQGMSKCTGSCKKLFNSRRCFECHTAHIHRSAHNHEEVSYSLDMGNAMSQAGEDVVPTFTTSNDRMLLLLANGSSGYLRIEDAERLQGLPEGYTKPAWPLQTPGVGAHRASSRRDADLEVAASKRWDLLGNAVTVPVARWIGERLASPYSYKYPTISIRDRRMDNLLTEGTPADGRNQPQRTHIWSYVTHDELQEAVLFPYLVRRKKDEDEVCSSDESDSSDDEGQLEACGFTADAAMAAAREAANEVEAAEPLECDCSLAPAAAAPAAEAAEGTALESQLEASMSQQKAGLPAENAQEPTGAAAAAEGAIYVAPEATQPAVSLPAVGMPAGASGPSATVTAAAATEPGPGSGNNQDAEMRNADQGRKDMFQAALAERAQRGKLRGNPRQQSAWDRESWPRAAWWVRGMGSFAVDEMSECPVLTPLIPLGLFIQEVGKPATQLEVEGYLNRLKERGWDCEMTIRRLLRNNVRIAPEVHEVVRIPGLLSDADMIGELVWAKDPLAQVWWPAEKLNPFGMPAGRELPPGAEAALSPEQKLASLPHYASYTGKSASPSAASKRVLVCFLPVGGSQWRWYHPDELERFQGNTDREREAQQHISQNKNWRWAEPLSRALQDANASLQVLNGRSSVEADRMRRTRAQSMAAGVNLKDRCGSCRTCMNSFVGQRRYECLTQRMKAAALAGHAGAQVAVSGEAALGARIAVWWDGDQTFFEGHIAHYDAVSTEHTVLYDDGEVGMHRLWQHDERIRVLSPVEQWPRDATIVRQKLRAAHDRLRALNKDKRATAAAAAAAAAAHVKPELTDYERQREEIIARNKAMFQRTVGVAAAAVRERNVVPPAARGATQAPRRSSEGSDGSSGTASTLPRTPTGPSGSQPGPPGHVVFGSPQLADTLVRGRVAAPRGSAARPAPLPPPGMYLCVLCHADGKPEDMKMCYLCAAAGLPKVESGAAHLDCVSLSHTSRTAKWACPNCQQQQRQQLEQRIKGQHSAGSDEALVTPRNISKVNKSALGGIVGLSKHYKREASGSPDSSAGPPAKKVRCGVCSHCTHPSWKKGCKAWKK